MSRKRGGDVGNPLSLVKQEFPVPINLKYVRGSYSMPILETARRLCFGMSIYNPYTTARDNYRAGKVDSYRLIKRIILNLK